MAVGLSAAMTTAKSALQAYQESLTVTSNNIANAGNANYHKQSTTLSDNVEILDTTGYYGTGVSISGITRSYSSALEKSLSLANTSNGYSQTYSTYASQVEDLIAPSGDSTLITDMTAFMKSIQDVETNPEDSTYREEFISAAKTLASTLNSDYASLNTIRDGIATTSGSISPATGNKIMDGGTASDGVDEVNSLLGQIASMNDEISNLETNSSNKSSANDLRDSRDALVQQLSSYMSISVNEDPTGRYNITTPGANGLPVNLVYRSGTGVSNYVSVANTVQGEFVASSHGSNYSSVEYYVYDDASATPSAIENTGELGAYSDSYSYVSDEMKKIYNLDYNASSVPATYMGYAQALQSTVNSELANGYGLNSATHPTVNLFTSDIANGSVLSVTSGYTYDMVAASSVASTNGNNANMDALWNFLNSDTTTQLYSSTSAGVESSVSTSLNAYANTYVNAISSTVSSATDSATTAKSAVTMYKNAIASASGVSSDQELTNMLATQQAYAASAKLISTIQTMYDSLFTAVS